MVGSSFYILYCCQLLSDSQIATYGFSVLLGAGAACVWTAHGFVLASHSTNETLER